MSSVPVKLEATDTAIVTRGLRKHFGAQRALAGLDLVVPEGAVYLMVGPNGAGKSTTIKVLLDLVRATTGAAKVFGMDTERNGATVRAQVGYVPEHQGLAYGWLPVWRLLHHHAAYYPRWDADYAERLSAALKVEQGRKFGKLSKGQKRRVELVMALAHRPPLLIMDEPTDGLDPLMRERVRGLIAEHLADTPTTLLISTHVVHEAEGLADHIGVIREGRLVAQVSRGDMDERLRRYRIELPEGWNGAPALESAVVLRNGADREAQWTVWGEERDVTVKLTESGAVVREVNALNLEDAALALLSGDEG